MARLVVDSSAFNALVHVRNLESFHERVSGLLRCSRALSAVVLVLNMAMLFSTQAQAAEGSNRQALTTNRLKVCADPANLPFSNKSLEGLENRIVELIADELDRDVRYTWYPQSTGFVRNTLRVRGCDVISGITTTSELVQNTNPYYYSVYAMVYRADSGIEARRVGDPALRDATIGVVAGTPPADILAAEGLLAQVRPYQLVTDTRRARPAEQALIDVAEGLTDVALIWGPIAGFYAKRNPDPELVVVPLLEEDKRIRLDYRVSMAVRYNETDWKRTVNRALAARKEDIDAILHEFGVPLLDDRRNLVSPPTANDAVDAEGIAEVDGSVAEPDGYRMDDYDAPVPAGLAGATTVAAAEVEALMRERRAIVIDVIPEHRQPADLPEGQLWFPPPHQGVPGALWLPDTGFGALDPVTEGYLFGHLETATEGDTSRALIFYCRIDCWMSWNAAKRAMAAGYESVYWYRDGIEDWLFEDMFTVPLTPAPGARQPDADSAG